MAVVVSIGGIILGSLLFGIGVWQDIRWLIAIGLVLIPVAMVLGVAVPGTKTESPETVEHQEPQAPGHEGQAAPSNE